MFDLFGGKQIEIVKTDKMYVEITSKCNLHCVHCYNDSGADKDTYMSMAVFERIISYVQGTDYKNIAISGGEPLLHPSFYEFVDLCRANKVSYTIVSNGTLINEHFIEYFADDPMLEGIQISVEGGSAAIHDLVRGEGTFLKLAQKLVLLRDNNLIDKTSLKMTLTRLNYQHMKEACDFAISLGVHQISFGWLNYAGRGAVNQDSLSLTQEIVAEVLQCSKYIEGKRGSTLCSGVGVAHICALSRFSPQMILSPRITPEGDVYPCSMFENNQFFTLGNLTESSLYDVLNSERTKALLYVFILRKDLLLKCQTCSVRSTCGKGCVARAYLTANTIFANDDFCDFNKMTILQSYRNVYKRKVDAHDG